MEGSTGPPPATAAKPSWALPREGSEDSGPLGKEGGQRQLQGRVLCAPREAPTPPHWPRLAKLTAGRTPSAIRQGDRVGPLEEGSREI